MSVESEIERIKNNISNAYSKISEKGGTLPENQNSSNLVSAIESISSSTKLAISYGLTPPSDTSNIWVRNAVEPVKVSIENYRRVAQGEDTTSYATLYESESELPYYSQIFYAFNDYAYALNEKDIIKINLFDWTYETILSNFTDITLYNNALQAYEVDNEIYIIFGNKFRGNNSVTGYLYKFSIDFSTFELITTISHDSISYNFNTFVYDKTDNVLYYGNGYYTSSYNKLIKYNINTSEKTTLMSGLYPIYGIYKSGNILYFASLYTWSWIYMYTYNLLTGENTRKTISAYIPQATKILVNSNSSGPVYYVYTPLSSGGDYAFRKLYLQNNEWVMVDFPNLTSTKDIYDDLYGFGNYIISPYKVIADEVDHIYLANNEMVVFNNNTQNAKELTLASTTTFDLKVKLPRFFIGDENNKQVEYIAYYYSETNGQWLNIQTNVAYNE